MKLQLTYLTITLTFQTILTCEHYHDPQCLDVKPIDGDHFLNQYIIEVNGGEEVAKQVARDTGFEYKKPMSTHEGHYFLRHPEVPDRHKMRHEAVLKILRDHSAVVTADQQYVWNPTIRELETYEDMVGLEEPIEVRTSYFDPSEIVFEEKTAHELVRPDDVFREPEPMIRDYPPIHTIVDFDKLYEEKNREKEKRAKERKLQEELRQKQEQEEEKERMSAENTTEENNEKETEKVKTSEPIPLSNSSKEEKTNDETTNEDDDEATIENGEE